MVANLGVVRRRGEQNPAYEPARPRTFGGTMVPEVRMRIDYSDEFRTAVRSGDFRTAEQWARAGLEESPAPLRALIGFVHRRLLRFELAPLGAPGHVLGWRIRESSPEIVRLEASGPVMRASIVGVRWGGVVTLTTNLTYEQPRLARALWKVLGPLHRRIAPYLLDRAARAGFTPERG